MKFLPIALLCMMFSQGLVAQKAMTFADAEQKLENYHKLDEEYKSAVHSEVELAVFKSDEEQRTHIESYQLFLQGLGKHLKSNGFEWETSTKCFNRIYFDKDGSIDYFLFHFIEENVPDEKAEQFRDLLEKYISDYRYPVTASVKFAQCGPVRYN